MSWRKHDWNEWKPEGEIRLASYVLPPIADAIRADLRKTMPADEAEDFFRVLLFYIEDPEFRYPPWHVARLAALLGYPNLKAYQIVLWRKALTLSSRRLVPELAALKARSPLILLYSSKQKK